MDQNEIKFPICPICHGLQPYEAKHFIARPMKELSCQCEPPVPEPAEPPAEWAIVSLMGHVTFSGRVSEEEKFGAKLGRCDIPQPDGTYVTRYFSGAALYSIVPCTEAAAKARAGCHSPAAVGLLSIPADSEHGDAQPEDDNDGLF